MPLDPNRLADLATLRQIDLQRVATWMLREATDLLDGLESDIGAAIMAIDPTGVNRLHAQVARLQRLLGEVQDLIRAIFREIRARLEPYFDDLIAIQEEKERNDFLLAVGVALVAVGAVALPKAKELLIQGATFKQWEKRQIDDLFFRVRNRLQAKVSEQAVAADMVSAIKGGGLLKGDGEIAPSKRAAEAIIRTAVDRVPNEVTTAVLDNQPASLEQGLGPYGWQQISILDSRTTPICRSYAYKVWDASFDPVGHKLPYDGGPPRHIYCRSRVIFIFLDDPVKPKSFKQWIGEKSKTEQDDIFGAKKMEMWRRGVISDAELIRQTDRQMTLDEYRAK